MVILYISNCIHYHRNKERERPTHNVYIIGEYNQVAMHDSGEGRMQVYYPRHKRVCNIFFARGNASASQTVGRGFNSRVRSKKQINNTWIQKRCYYCNNTGYIMIHKTPCRIVDEMLTSYLNHYMCELLRMVSVIRLISRWIKGILKNNSISTTHHYPTPNHS